jgi:hypothetical protein
MRHPGFLLLCSALLCPAAAIPAQPVTEDPLAADPKLQRRVTVEAEGVSVGELLALLSRKTGVRLRTTSETAEDKAIVFSRERPLRHVLSDLAALFGDVWQRHTLPNGDAEYVLVRTTRAREQERRLARARMDAFLAHMDAQAAALAETPEQLARRPAEDPIRAQLTEYTGKNVVPSYGRVGTRLYAQLNRAQQEQLFTRKRLTVPFASMTPAQRTLAREAFAKIVGRLEAEAKREIEQGIETPDTIPPTVQDLEAGLLQFRVTLSPQQTSIGMMLGLSSRNRSGRQPYALFGHWKNDRGWLLPAHGNPYTGQSVARDAVLPIPQHIRAAQELAAWPDRLRKLADESRVAVLADYYRCLPLRDADESTASPPSPPAEDSLEVLDAFCRDAPALWWVRGTTLLFRRRDWYDQKRYEVPDGWLVETARRITARQGVPTQEDAFRLLDLTPQQMEGLYRIASGHDVTGVRELLALVKASPTTLTYTQFTPGQQALLPALLDTLSYPVTSEQIAGLRLSWSSSLRRSQPSPAGQALVEAMLSFSLGKGTPQQARIVLLPRTLPDDRRDKTRIEVDRPSS